MRSLILAVIARSQERGGGGGGEEGLEFVGFRIVGEIKTSVSFECFNSSDCQEILKLIAVLFSGEQPTVRALLLTSLLKEEAEVKRCCFCLKIWLTFLSFL